MMKSIKWTAAAISVVMAGGCSTIWTGIADVADFMAEETQFLSLRKAPKTNEVFTQGPADTYTGQSGSYVPSDNSLYPDAYTPASVPGQTADCPAGSYLTPENTCMISQASTSMPADGYERMASLETTSYSANPYTADYSGRAMIAPVQRCPEGTYMTPQKTCMKYETRALAGGLHGSSMNSGSNMVKISSYKPQCPEGTYMTGQNECRASAELVPDIYL